MKKIKNKKLKILHFGLQFLILHFAFLIASTAPVRAGELANQFTIELWVKPTGSVASKAILVKNNEIRLVTNASGQPLCQIYSGGAWQTAATSSTALSLNTWSHVACSYDKANLRVFVNGIQSGSQALTATVNDASTNFRVGSDEGATYGDLNGIIDDIRIYNYARTQKQIVEDMNAGHPAVGSPVGSPVAYYKFDEGYGITVNNLGLCGSSCNGTLGTGSSAPSWTNDGKFGKALSFDGGDQVTATITDPGYYNTLSLWLNPNTSIASKTLITSSKLTTDSSSRPVYGGCTGTAIPLNQWTHLVVTSDGSGTCKIYQNGKLTASGTTGITFGTSVNIGALSYSGLIDEVKIYNYALSEEEIKAEYNRGAAMILGSLSDTSGLSGGSVASNSASAEYCVPGDTAYCAPPVGRWDFNEGTGTTAYDTSGRNNGTLGVGNSAPTWATGKFGKALSFDGNDYVSVPHSSVLEPQEITITSWVNPSSKWDSNHRNIVDKGANSGYRFRIDGSTRTVSWFDRGGTNYITSNTTIPTQKWSHIAVVGSNTGLKIYINGKLDKSNTVAYGAPTPGGTLKIGDDNGVSDLPFLGLIDQVRTYSYARTPAQIAWDFNRGQPVAWWKFDECIGTTAYDSSDNGNHGTITIGTSGSQTSAGTCTTSGTAWSNGATGKYNSSLNFDGTDDYVSTSNIALIAAASQTYSDVSLGAWVKASSNQTSKTIIHKSGEFRLYTNSNGYPTCQVGDTGNTAAATSTLPNDTWSHLLCTYDGSNIKIYLNGTQIASNSRTGTITSSSSTNINIAQKSDSSERYAGQIDDVRIYNYALTPVLVKQLYNEGAIRFGPASGNP